MIVDENTLRSKIYTIRGQQVMLDSDLADIYGYTTKAFNQQVKNIIEKFPVDFRFQLTAEEVAELSKSKNFDLDTGCRCPKRKNPSSLCLYWTGDIYADDIITRWFGDFW